MQPILLILAGAVLVTISVKYIAMWMIRGRTVRKIGYPIAVAVIVILMIAKWLIYQNHDRVYLTYVLIGAIVGIIFGMLPKTKRVLISKKECWFMDAVAIYFLLIIYAFASLYFCIEIVAEGSFAGYTPWNSFWAGIGEFLYFSISTFSTVGFGDIHPVSTIAKFASCAEILVMFRTVTLGALFISREDVQTEA